MRLSKPGRHLLTDNGLPYRLGPRTRNLVCHERHWSKTTWPVTYLTVFLKNRQDVLVERHEWGLVGRASQGRELRSQCRHRREHNESEKSGHKRAPNEVRIR